MTEFQIATVEDLINRGVLEKPLDGNHGGLHPKNSDYVDEGIPFIMASDIDRDRINFENCKYITREQASTLRKGFAKEGDVLLSHKATIGKTAVVENIPTDFIVLTPQVTYYRILDESILDRYYLLYYFKSPYFQSILNSWSGSGSTRAYISITEQRKLPILLPSIDVQKRITSILRSLDLKIELNLKMNKTLEEMAMTLYKHWFVDFGPFQDGEFVESELGMIPKGWRVGNLGDLIQVQNGYAFKSKEWKSEGIPVIKIKNISPPLINKEDVAYVDVSLIDKLERFILKQGDLLIGMTGAEIGKCGIYYYEEPAFLNQRVGKFYSNNDEINTLPLVYTITRLPDFQQKILDNSTGSAQPNISADGIRSLKIVLPPTDILKEFINLINDTYSMIINNANENYKLKNIRDYLLPRLLSGEIDLSEAEKQVEEVL